MLREGETYKRSKLHDEYGGNRQGGIASCRKSDMILLFTGNSGKEHGYEDGWKSNEIFHYTGEGQVGDMEFKRGNKSIRDHLKDGKEIYLFEQSGDGFVKCLGEMEYNCHQIREGIDRNNHKRNIIVFELHKKPTKK
ncbi:5-methylcytosine-specific restriction protein A [Methanohalophilus euhalobius]|uniref:5-methylcytosine-specific restriction enzyme A n=1 Tax=Methanohalophilus euhalobius TaxID=51203 RepID=A0A285F4D0_9EURY|nr:MULTISPECIES: HNH endonuclease [Methanohalophilus]ODV49943.1 MAG: HNH endonuclease [Methanohalophilus sp. 2-GBenrich]RXG34877.1 HNH endonuclease [Methanohalophilus sp. WG1-DM]TCL12360.1 5-methylcytosine-specific restriction protein A [Methanohalophilus euhalobius]SNY06122.1 5-methylcytosine-specific restriction enzyme A [Methanohalophilus euhalobius]